jgi:hypothetical protein
MFTEHVSPPRLATFLTDDLVAWRVVFRREGVATDEVIQPCTLDHARGWLRVMVDWENVTRASIHRIPLTEVL